ncbi:MAG: PilW family protein [Sulfuriferula sp.]
MNFNRSLSLRQTGFSLMELMIAITIGFIVVAGVGYLYLGSRQTFNAQDSLSAIQENSRFALDTMSRDIRMAGYMGCGNLGVYAANTGTLATIASAPAIAAVLPGTAVQVFPGGVGWTPPAGITRAAGDVLRVSGADPSGVSLAGPAMPGSAAAIHVSGNPGNFQAGDVLLISDCTDAVIFAATTVSSGMVTIAHGSSVNTVPYLSATHQFVPPALGTGTPGAQVYAFRQTDYFVGCPTVSWAGGQCSVPLALYQVINNGVPQPLVDNVENMAFMLGVDTSTPPPNVPPAQVVGGPYQTPTFVASANGGAGNWARVLSVQVHLLMVGGPANAGRSNVAVASQPYNFIINGATYAAYPADRRMRQDATATIAIRNRLP